VRLEGLSLLLMIAAALSILPAGATCSGCGCYTPCPTEAEIQQFHWMKEAYCFLYSDDCYGSALVPRLAAPLAIQPAGEDTAAYWMNEASGFYLAGSYEQAAASYAKAVEKDPSLWEGWLNMGNALFFLSRYQDSLNAYESAIRLNPQNENAYLGKSRALAALNRNDEADAAMRIVEKLRSRKIAELGGTRDPAESAEPVLIGSH